MKYFTPERYYSGQSLDDDIADLADADWDEQIRLYSERLKEIDNELPHSVRQFMKACCLHDADIDKWMDFGVGMSSPHKLQLVIHQQGWGDQKFVCVLRYKMALSGPLYMSGVDKYPVESKNHSQGCFKSAGNVQWLYDEFDYLGTAQDIDIFSHNILFSCGLELNIHFSEFHFMLLPIGEGFIEF